MCGIIYARNKKGNSVAGLVWQKYAEQRSRGTEGFGFVAIDKNGIAQVFRAEKEKTIKEMLSKCNDSEILFHHRYPTSTPNIIQATHPIIIKMKDNKFNYAVVHNGVITNDEELKAEHEKMGYTYNTRIIEKTIAGGEIIKKSECFNDSEALAVEVALYLEKRKEKIDARGSIALIALRLEKETNKVVDMFYGRNLGNPLKIKRSKKSIVISSENPEGVMLPTDTLYQVAGDTVKDSMVKIGEYSSYSSYYQGGRFWEDDEVVGKKTCGFDCGGYDYDEELEEDMLLEYDELSIELDDVESRMQMNIENEDVFEYLADRRLKIKERMYEIESSL